MDLHIEAFGQFVIHPHAFPMVVVRHIAVQAVVRREFVDQVLLMVIGGHPQAVQRAPVQRLVRVKAVLRIIGKRVAQARVAHVTVESELGGSRPIQLKLSDEDWFGAGILR